MAKILVVEDDDLMRELIGFHLGNAGHSVVACPDGAEAIRSVLAEKPDLVFLDLGMPFIDGFELLAAFKGDPLTQAIPVIVLSSRTDLGSLERIIALGASDYLNKPIRAEQLLSSLERVLKAGPKARPL